MPNPNFNYIKWKKDFDTASEKRLNVRELRIEIFEGTIKIVQNGGYYIDNTFVNINNILSDNKSEYFDAPGKLKSNANYQTKFSVINADCLETAEIFVKAGLNPCVLNLASGYNPGGGVTNGAGAQEENIFRRTNLFLSLYQFASYAEEYSIKKHTKSYPLNKKTGGIYSTDITVFRGSEKNGYCLLKNPYNVSFVTVSAISKPDLIKKKDRLYIADSLVEPTKEKNRTILRIAGKYNHECLVLGAFGCGAYANPPNHMAQLFNEVFCEEEFYSKFKLVVFSIFDDYNSYKEHNPNGNVLPFLEVFDRM